MEKHQEEAGVATDRSLERQAEEQSFVSVIVKRHDEARRHPDDILQIAVAEGTEQLERRTVSLALSALAAGLVLTFSVMAVAIAYETGQELGFGEHAMRVAIALAYPLGFVVCIMSGSELFTEHTATAVYPVLDGKARVGALLRLWGIVLFGNIAGALLGAVLLWLAEPVITGAAGYVALGTHLIAPALPALFVSAVLAGVLMALGAWLVLSTPPMVSQIVCIYLVTFLIGLGGLHHSIAGTVELAMFALAGGAPSVADVGRFAITVVAGNLVGGSLFVGALNYGHIRRTRATDK